MKRPKAIIKNIMANSSCESEKTSKFHGKMCTEYH